MQHPRSALPPRPFAATIALALWLAPLAATAHAEEPAEGDALLARYFASETAAISGAPLDSITSREDWAQKVDGLRRDLAGMLGLDPMPEKTPLEPVVTGTVEGENIVVERLHFQSLPGLYVTANLYRPKDIPEGERLPAVLYVCGHGGAVADGISYGNKTTYRHHGAWFARNGYVCLVIDTIQLGEIEGIHHGTYRFGHWWWNARGYTPAGVEAWNSIRATDYLTSRDEVDPDRIGVTGRSGGGAYSWWVAALDERIKVAVPVAGITTMKNHVVDGCVEGHCDCMYFINTERWDFGAVAALVAPRPLLISNTDKDTIFPLDGVVEVYNEARRIYELVGAGDKIGLQISEGGHKDTQQLRVAAFHWFNRFLKDDASNTPISDTAESVFTPEELKVFPPHDLPSDERVTSIHESFVPAATPPADSSSGDGGSSQQDQWMAHLREDVFGGWPTEDAPLDLQQAGETAGHRTTTFVSQEPFVLGLHIAVGLPDDGPLLLHVHDAQSWEALGAGTFEGPASIHFAPRGVGPTAWSTDERYVTHARRRFHLLGQSLDAMQVYDIRRALQAVRAMPEFAGREVAAASQRTMATNLLYASLFEPPVSALDLVEPAPDHRDGPIYPQVSRFLAPPQAAAMAAGRSPVEITTQNPDAWKYAADADGDLTVR